jgi:hypothetical protein
MKYAAHPSVVIALVLAGPLLISEFDNAFGT